MVEKVACSLIPQAFTQVFTNPASLPKASKVAFAALALLALALTALVIRKALTYWESEVSKIQRLFGSDKLEQYANLPEGEPIRTWVDESKNRHIEVCYMLKRASGKELYTWAFSIPDTSGSPVIWYRNGKVWEGTMEEKDKQLNLLSKLLSNTDKDFELIPRQSA